MINGRAWGPQASPFVCSPGGGPHLHLLSLPQTLPHVLQQKSSREVSPGANARSHVETGRTLVRSSVWGWSCGPCSHRRLAWVQGNREGVHLHFQVCQHPDRPTVVSQAPALPRREVPLLLPPWSPQLLSHSELSLLRTGAEARAGAAAGLARAGWAPEGLLEKSYTPGISPDRDSEASEFNPQSGLFIHARAAGEGVGPGWRAHWSGACTPLSINQL